MSSAAATLTPRALYRLQLATARHCDALPAIKPLLSLGLRQQHSFLPPTVHAALTAFLSPSPSTSSHPVYSSPRSLAAHVAATARGGAIDVPSAAAAQAALARLCDTAALYAASPEAALYSTALAAAAAAAPAPLAEADSVRPGSLLLEHPSLLHPGRGMLLIYDIVQGVAELDGHTRWVLKALACNRPLPGASAAALLPHAAEALGPLGALPVFSGGPAAPSELLVLHKMGDLPGAVPLDGPPPEEGASSGSGSAHPSLARSGLYLGGELDALKDAVARGGGGGENSPVHGALRVFP